MKKLTELNPKWTGRLRPDSGEALEFDCPKCQPTHRVVVYFTNPLDEGKRAGFNDELWTRDGKTFDTVSVSPSIDYGYKCFHGWIERGNYIDVSEAPVKVPLRIQPGGPVAMVGLSPLQALDYASKITERAEVLLK